jgi:hypothetical protein
VTFQTQDSYWSSWIMAQGQIKGIHLFYTIFLESLPINYTTLKLTTNLEEALGNNKYHNLGSGITSTSFILVLLDHCSRTNIRDSSIFYNLSGEFAHKLHYFKVDYLPRRPLGKVTLNVQILESLHSKGTKILFGGFQIIDQ